MLSTTKLFDAQTAFSIQPIPNYKHNCLRTDFERMNISRWNFKLVGYLLFCKKCEMKQKKLSFNYLYEYFGSIQKYQPLFQSHDGWRLKDRLNALDFCWTESSDGRHLTSEHIRSVPKRLKMHPEAIVIDIGDAFHLHSSFSWTSVPCSWVQNLIFRFLALTCNHSLQWMRDHKKSSEVEICSSLLVKKMELNDRIESKFCSRGGNPKVTSAIMHGLRLNGLMDWVEVDDLLIKMSTSWRMCANNESRAVYRSSSLLLKCCKQFHV